MTKFIAIIASLIVATFAAIGFAHFGELREVAAWLVNPYLVFIVFFILGMGAILTATVIMLKAEAPLYMSNNALYHNIGKLISSARNTVTGCATALFVGGMTVFAAMWGGAIVICSN